MLVAFRHERKLRQITFNHRYVFENLESNLKVKTNTNQGH